jgi:hypothetical protein
MSKEAQAQAQGAGSTRSKGAIAGTGPSVHVDAPLSDYSLKVVQDDDKFKARKIVSNFNSAQRSNLYYFYEPAYFIVNQVTARAEGTEAAMAKYGVKRKNYSTTVYGLKQPVTDEVVANADKPVDRVYEDAVKFITRQFLLNKEKRLAEALLKAGVWSTDLSGQAGALSDPSLVIENDNFQQFSQATSRPLDVLDAAMERVQLVSGMRPNTLVMPRSVFTALKRNSTIKTVKLYTNSNSGSDSAILDTIATHLDIPADRVFVLDVVTPATNATIDGATYAITTDTEGQPSGTEDDDSTRLVNEFIGGNGILLMHVDMESNGMYQATAAVCCQWTGLYPDGGDLGNTMMKRYREERLSSEMIEGRTAFSYHITAPSLGAYLDKVI